MSKHPHAELMAQYAQDALETDKPWERWEYKSLITGQWRGTGVPIVWDSTTEYRRKPKTETKNHAKYVHHFTRVCSDGLVEIVGSMLNATHISIYKVDEEGYEQWVHDVELPEALLAIFNIHQTAVELHNQLQGINRRKTATVTEQQIEDMWWKLQSVLHEMFQVQPSTDQLDNAIADLQSALKTLHDLGKEVK